MEADDEHIEDDTVVLTSSTPAEASTSTSSSEPADTRTDLASQELLLQTAESDVASPQQAMRYQEVRRTRFFAAFAGTLASLACGLAFLLPGNRMARDIHFAIAALTALSGFALASLLRDGSRYRSWMSTAFGLIATAATAAGYYFWGVNSAIILVIPIGTFFFALGESYRSAMAIHLFATLSHALISALQILHVIPDVGMITSETFNDVQRWGILLALQIIFLGSFIMARAMRRSTLDTLEQLDGAVRGIAQREALLEEAKEELAQALQIGGPGRFTGQVMGSFRLGAVIGRGGMGEVYEALHVASGDLAAVKMLSREGMTSSDQVARFYRELDVTATIGGEHVVRVLEHPEASSPIPYLAMERLRGRTLAERLRSKPSMPMDEVVELANALCSGIGAAHELDIVHRDLKPSNIYGHEEGERLVWKILDFGVSKLQNQGGTLTQGKVIGTPSYMSPEQATGEEVGARADLYAIGVILYRALTGRRAFMGSSIPALLRAVHADMPPRPSQLADLAHDIDCVLAIAMAKKPEDRFASAAELAQTFERASRDQLDEPMRQRAEQLMERYPWNKRNVI